MVSTLIIRDKYFPFFFLIYNLFMVQITEAKCLITSKSSGLCAECASDYYNPNFLNSSSASGPPLFSPTQCLKKRNMSESIHKTIYVSSQPCVSDETNSHYCDLGESLVKEAQATQSYQNGTLKFLLIGSTHQISSTAFPFPGLELFKRNGNIAITIETLSR